MSNRRLAFRIAVILVALLSPLPAGARSLFSRLFGQPPDSTSRIARSPDQGIDSLDVPAWADLGYISLPDLVTRLAGGDAARLGMDAVIDPIDLTGAGRGRTSILFNGLPAGDGVVHWDNYAWVPLRALTTLGIERDPSARTDASAVLPGGRIVAATRSPGPQPLSAVALTGGSFGHRLAELDFCRMFGKYGFHIDGADFNHAGFGAFGPAHLARGFGELTLPLFGFRTALGVAISSTNVSGPGSAGGGGLQNTAERRYTAILERGSGRNTTQLSLLRHSSHFGTGGFSDIIPFTLDDGRWRAGYRRSIPAGRGALGFDLAVTREKRTGVIPEPKSFQSEEGVLSYTRPSADGFGYTGRIGVARREPTGFAFEPGLRIFRDGSAHRFWVEGGRTTGIPAILLDQDQAAPDVFGIKVVLDGLENLARPESHIGFETGLVIGGAGREETFRAHEGAPASTDTSRAIPPSLKPAGPARAGFGIVAGANHTTDSPGFLSPSRGTVAFQPITNAFWTGRVDAAAFWAPRRDLEFSLRGGYHFFDLARQPFEPNLTADGSLTIRRDFFEHDLHLSASAGGELTGRRKNPDGETYPAVVTGSVTLTGRIKSLTLFWRTENVANLYIESDLREQGTPVALPALYNRIGATLRLVD